MSWEKGGTPAEARVVHPQPLSNCCLMKCVYEPQGEHVCVCVAGWGRGSYRPTPPPPQDCACLTGWRGRWGHCNKANTYTFFYGCYVLASPLFPASTLPSPVSFQDLHSPLQPCSRSSCLNPCLPASWNSTFRPPPVSAPSLAGSSHWHALVNLEGSWTYAVFGFFGWWSTSCSNSWCVSCWCLVS